MTATLLAAVPAHADDPVLHHVKYTVGASQPLRAEIYYRDMQPPTFADYSHNPYVYSPNVEADLGPGKPWVLEAMLADPQDWAMVVATKPEHMAELSQPGFVCELRVDDIVVATDSGTKGVLCSQRSW
ncbi:MAG: hypothetical protein HYZ39_24030 [Mycolicibacterium cosmeticum]|nr:hypothetical protein [Mycolicibacterium cosmeticum]